MAPKNKKRALAATDSEEQEKDKARKVTPEDPKPKEKTAEPEEEEDTPRPVKSKKVVLTRDDIKFRTVMESLALPAPRQIPKSALAARSGGKDEAPKLASDDAAPKDSESEIEKGDVPRGVFIFFSTGGDKGDTPKEAANSSSSSSSSSAPAPAVATKSPETDEDKKKADRDKAIREAMSEMAKHEKTYNVPSLDLKQSTYEETSTVLDKAVQNAPPWFQALYHWLRHECFYGSPQNHYGTPINWAMWHPTISKFAEKWSGVAKWTVVQYASMCLLFFVTHNQTVTHYSSFEAQILASCNTSMDNFYAYTMPYISGTPGEVRKSTAIIKGALALLDEKADTEPFKSNITSIRAMLLCFDIHALCGLPSATKGGGSTRVHALPGMIQETLNLASNVACAWKPLAELIAKGYPNHANQVASIAEEMVKAATAPAADK